MDGWTDIWMDVEIEKEGTRRVGSRGGGHSKQPNLAKHLVAIDLETNERTSERASERASKRACGFTEHKEQLARQRGPAFGKCMPCKLPGI